ncbi:hypothetical protein QR680_018438 [Steinernema hermaphroditum]|uniref:RZZ complex subunit KNTC1/ROD C-terminal domain-containing protein n=1 Tax=Steinernema hermaphroditum TaxID=289476 RepID=A0AA39HHY5_9BILA|nr:hypothetical protein QR680_018438 [Steinernema hermaphroditum]
MAESIGRFTNVQDFDDDFEVTRNFASEFKTEKSLYEVATLSAISPDAESFDQSFPAVLSTTQVSICSSGNKCFLANSVGCDLTLHEIGSKTHFRFSLDTQAPVMGMAWLPKADILLTVLNDGRFLFVHPSSEQSATYPAVELDRPLQRCKVTTSVQDSTCLVVLSEETGVVFVAHMPNYDEVIESKAQPERFAEIFHAAASSLTVPADYNFEKPVIHVGMQSCFGICFPTEPMEPARIATCSGAELEIDFDEFEEPEDCVGYTTVRRHGNYLFALVTTNELIVYEEFTMMQLARLNIGHLNDGQRIVDFHFFDLADDLSNLEGCKLVLVVEAEQQYKMEVVQFSINSPQLQYSVDVATDSVIVPEIMYDSGLVFVEPFPGNKHAVFIRSMVESLPELRMEKLIKTRRFEQAEKFAKDFNLDLQKVYRAMMNDALDQLYATENPDDDLYQNVLNSFKKVHDSNEIADLCANAVSSLDRFDWIMRFLTYVESRKSTVTDTSTLEHLAMLRYKLTTYRQIFDPLKANKEVEEIASWKDFIANDCADVFKALCESGMFQEARLVWHRHVEVSKCFSDMEYLNVILNDMATVICTKWSLVKPAIELLEGEILPYLVMNADKVMCEVAIEWVMDIARKMEEADAKNFPQNSLWVSEALKRAIRSLTQSAVTPKDQAHLMQSLALLQSDSQEQGTAMGNLNVYAHDLNVMSRLRERYHLVMSYQTFKDQNVDSICHMILERIKSVEKIREQVQKFAIPYMEENRLRKDETLYNYICAVAGENIFKTTSNSNPWDERCLEISQVIGNIHIRCRAVIDIARRSRTPWTSSLTAAVNSMLREPSLDKDLIKELHRQCQLAEFGKILIRYEIPLSVRENAEKFSRSFVGILKRICRPEMDGEARQRRIEDCLELVRLLKKLGSSLADVKPEFIYSTYATAIINDLVNKSPGTEVDCSRLTAFMNEVPVEMRHIVAESLIEKNSMRLNRYALTRKSTKEKEHRLLFISVTLCIVERFYRGDKKKLSDVMRAIRVLQSHENFEKFKMCVGPDFFEGTAQRHAFFVAYVNQMKQWSWSEVVFVSSALLLDRSEACQLAVKAGIAGEVNPAFILTMLREYINSQWELDDSFLQTSMSSINYTLKQFSSLSEKVQESGMPGTGVVVECVELLHEILPSLLNSAGQKLFNQLAKVIRYIETFVLFLKQCYLDENGFGDQMELDTPTETEATETSVSEIYGINPRVGVYHVRRDGTVYDRDGGVKAFATVATTVLDDVQEGVSDQRMNWAMLFDFLKMYNQSLIEVHSRALAASLTNDTEERSYYLDELYDCVFQACTKILAVPQGADLWLAAALICTLDDQQFTRILLGADKTDGLKNWAVGKRNPRVIISCLRVSQLMFAMKGDSQLWNQFAKRYTLMMWTKKLAKFKGNMPSPKQCQDIAVCVKEFVRCLLPTPIIKKYCFDMDIDVDEVLAQYAFTLCVKSGSETDLSLQKKMIDLADAALLGLKSTNAFDRIFNTLMVVCPYQYDVLQVLVRHLRRFGDSDENQTIVRELQVILDYIVNNPRQSDSCNAEVKWYQERQKLIAVMGCFTGQAVTLSDTAPLNPDTSDASDDFYERQEIVAKKLPQISEQRLPFHVFLLESAVDKKTVLLPVINQELSVTSVNGWIMLISYLQKYIRLSRTEFLTEAIKKQINRAANMSCSLSRDESKRIHELIYSAKERARQIVTKCLVTICDNLSLTELNLDVLRIGASVMKEYQKVNPDNERDGRTIHQLDIRIKKNSTKYILLEKNLLNPTTEDLVNEPRDLIAYIYAHLVDWNDVDDIAFKTDLVMKVADVNELDIHEIHYDIVRKWLEENDKTQGLSDADATFEDIATTMQPSSDNAIATVPYNDISTTRIVCLMRLCLESNERDKLIALIRHIGSRCPPKNTSACDTVIQLMCCSYRCFKGEEFAFVFGGQTHEEVTEQMVTLFYKRLLNISYPDAVEAFKQMDKTMFVRDLVNNVTRNKNDLPHLLGCVIADYGISDAALIFTVAQRLMNRPKSLYNLLKYCKSVDGIAARGKANALVMYWIAVFKALFHEKRDSNDEGQLRGLLCFLLSCPVELGQAVTSLTLGQQQFYATEVLSSIAANPTCQVDGRKLNLPRNSKDLSLGWMHVN